MKLHTILISCILLFTVSADLLQNPDFELPPSNWSAVPFFPLNQTSTTLPGWSFQGDVQYVTAGANLPLPGNGHAILIGQDGKINQTFTANGDEKQYLLTFTLAGGGGRNCTANASVVVSAPDSSAQFSSTVRYGKAPWGVYGLRLGSWGGGEAVNLVLESQSIDGEQNATCWPVVDGLLLTAIGSVEHGIDDLLPNGDFESGPAFPESSSDGVLLDTEPSLTESALQQWTIMGTIKYIDAKNHFVPQGKAAIELVSGESAGVQTATHLTRGSDYNLRFMLGHTNDNCSGDFTVRVTAGSTVQNFTIHINGTGSARDYSVGFKGDGPSLTTIGFQSYTSGRSCGPVIDGVVLRRSGGFKTDVRCALLIVLLLGVLMKMSELL